MASSFEELLGLGSYAGNHASQGRVSVLNLQEVTGTTAFDTGGVENNGTYWGTGSNPVSVPGPTAWLPNAVSFDGTNVRVDYGGEVASLDDWTIACWFRTTQTGNDRWIMSEGSTASNTPGIGIVVQSGNLRCFCRSSGTVNFITSKTVNDGNWHFAQFSRSGTDFYVYCDGELITSGGSLVDNPATNISGIGCFRRASASLFAQSQIAGVYKFSRMLSLSEHQFLFAGPEGGEEPEPTDIIGSSVIYTAASGNLTSIGLVSGESNIISLMMGVVSSIGFFNGNSESSSQSSGSLDADGYLSGWSETVSSATGILSSDAAGLVGNSITLSSGEGTLGANASLSSSPEVLSASIGNLTSVGFLEGEGSVDSISVGVLSFTSNTELQGSSESITSASGTLEGIGSLIGSTRVESYAEGIFYVQPPTSGFWIIKGNSQIFGLKV